MNRAMDTVPGNWHTNGLLTLRGGITYTLNGASCQGVWSRCEPDIVSGIHRQPGACRRPQGPVVARRQRLRSTRASDGWHHAHPEYDDRPPHQDDGLLGVQGCPGHRAL
jgi:hypothetical protein